MATTNYSGGGQYEAAKRGIENDYTNRSATNAYGRFLSQQRGTRQLGDQQRSFQRSYPNYAASFGRRGLNNAGVTSGVMERSMGNYIGDYNRDFARTQQDITQGLQQFDLSQANLDSMRQNELMNIELARANDIASTASQLDMLRQYFGGL